MKYVDLRSDTVTKPSKPMLEAMMNAEVGDDVFGEDPTVNALQKKVAEMFGKESALFVPSGTMGNEICVKVHTSPGEEIIVEENSHIIIYETAAPSLLSGVQMKPVPSIRGAINVEDLRKAVRPNVYYMPRTKLICLENTHGRSAGSIVPIENIQAVHAFASEQNISLHLDGARIWNACVATGIRPKEYAKYFDSISVCFSKGLGAPIGSAVVGDAKFVENARRYRKIFGGGMRQAGLLAAAALYAIEYNIERLKVDHDKARYFASELNGLSKISIDMNEVQTNMVFVDIAKTGKSQSEILELLKSHSVLMTPERHSSLRAVMHLDVSMDEVKHTVQIFHKLFA